MHRPKQITKISKKAIKLIVNLPFKSQCDLSKLNPALISQGHTCNENK